MKACTVNCCRSGDPRTTSTTKIWQIRQNMKSHFSPTYYSIRMLLVGAHRMSGLWGGKCFFRVHCSQNIINSSIAGFRQIAQNKAKWPKQLKSVIPMCLRSRYHWRFGKLRKAAVKKHKTNNQNFTETIRNPFNWASKLKINLNTKCDKMVNKTI